MISTIGKKLLRVRQAFTLIELMMVVAIVGILMASIVVGVQGVRSRAMKSAVKGQLSRIQMMIENYKTAHGTYPVPDGSLIVTKKGKPIYAPNVFKYMTPEQRLFALLYSGSDEYRQEEIREEYVVHDVAGTTRYLKEDGSDTTNPSDPGVIKMPELIDKYGNRIAFRITRDSYFVYSLGDDGVTAANDGLDNDGDSSIDESDEETLNGKIGDDIVVQ